MCVVEVTMEGLKFSADRFKRKEVAKPVEKDGVNNDSVNTKDDVHCEQSDRDAGVDGHEELEKTNKGDLIYDSQYYSLANKYKNLPKLNDDETLLNFEIVSETIAILTTSYRIIAYSFKTHEKNPFVFEFHYTANEYSVLPLCTVILNPVNSLKPDLVIIDPISGDLVFFESIKLSASLSILQNMLKSRVKLFNAEFLIGIEQFQENSIMVTTSQKRVIQINFKNQFGESAITYNQIFSNRPLMSFMLSKSYSIKELENSSRIVSLKSYDSSPVTKLIVILESTGLVSFIENITGSSSFVLKHQIDMTVFNNESVKFLDFQFSISNGDSDKRGVFLVLNEDNRLASLIYDFNETENPKIISSFQLPLMSRNEKLISPKLFLMEDAQNNKSSIVIRNDNKLIVLDLAYQSNTSSWHEIICFEPSLNIYEVNSIETIKHTLFILTNEGIIEFYFKKSGVLNDALSFVEDRITQYLTYSNDSSKIIFDLKDSSIFVDDSIVKTAIINISEQILENNTMPIKLNEVTIEKTLFNRVDLIKKLIIYASNNCAIDDDEFKLKLLKACGLLSVNEKFYQLCAESKLLDEMNNCLKNLDYSNSFAQYVQRNCKDILNLIFEFIRYVLDSSNETLIIQLSSLLKDLFIGSLIKLDDDFKKYINDFSNSIVLLDHFDLIKSMNDVTRIIYNLSNECENESTKNKYNEILIGLSFVLYYSNNEIVNFLKSNRVVKNNSILPEFNNLLEKDKNKWIHIFIVLNKQDDIVPLVTKYRDFMSLSLLLESKRETLQSLYNEQLISDIEFTNLATDVEFEFDNYFELFGYEFATTLFKQYIKSNKINIMLNNFQKHSDFLSEFLLDHPEYYEFAWIHDIQTQNFDGISEKMSDYLSKEESNPLKKMKFQSSVGKLTAICKSESSGMYKRNLITTFNSSLTLVSIQEYMYSKMSNFGMISNNYDTNQLYETEYLSNNDFKSFRLEIKKIYEKIVAKTFISLTEVITFVTLTSFFPIHESGIFTDEFPLKNDYPQDDIRACIAEDFIGEMICKILHLLNNYAPFASNTVSSTDSSNDIDSCNNNIKSETLMKLLYRRIVLRNDWSYVSKRVSDYINEKSLLTNFSKSNLIISREDLNLIGISNEEIICDYERENNLLV